MNKPYQILQFIYDRLINIHKEHPVSDYMIAFSNIKELFADYDNTLRQLEINEKIVVKQEEIIAHYKKENDALNSALAIALKLNENYKSFIDLQLQMKEAKSILGDILVDFAKR